MQLRKWKKILKKIPLMGVSVAFIFAAQMLNFPIAGGTSGHFVGGVLVAILLGPWAGILVMTQTPIVQCLVFQDGSLTALGANIFILFTSFMYRYMYLFLRFAKNMEIARGLKYFGKNHILFVKMYANNIGLLFIKAYKKGEMIHNAVILRGFDDGTSDWSRELIRLSILMGERHFLK